MSYLKSAGTTVIYIGLFLGVITFIPGLPPEGEFSEYHLVVPSEVKQPFELQNRLEGADVLFSEELKGPESFDSYAGELYTTLHGGYVVKIEENRIVPIVKFGKQCDGIWQEDKCGRPLGLKFNDKGDLFVSDAYYGIFKVDVRTGQYKLVINTSEPINGKIPKIPNSLDIAKNGDIYWTDSSSDFYLYDGVYTGLANPSGRLIKYNAATKKNEVLLEKLAFANGVKLSEDESFVIVLETWASRIIKYYLKGPKAGSQEIFAEGLPGLPDNVHSDKQGGFLVSLIVYTDADHPILTQSLIPHPNIRKMFARLLYLLEAPLKLMQEFYPNPYAERFIHSIGSFEATGALDIAKISVVLRMDTNGKVLDALYSKDKTVSSISSAFIHNDYIWLGSPFSERILRVPLEKALPDVAMNREHTVYIREKRDTESQATKSKNVKVEAKPKSQKTAKPAAEANTAKPATTTTTPKPTTQKPTTTTPKPAVQKPTTTTPKPAVQKPTTTTPKPAVQKPTTTTQKPAVEKPTTTTPKPAAQKPPTQKATTTATTPTTTTPKPTTTKPTNPTTSKPAASREASKQSNTPKTTPKPPTTTASPPTQKQVKEEIPKSSSSTDKKPKTSAPNSKTEQAKKTKSTESNSKPSKPIEENVRDTQSEKTKTGKTRPNDASTKK